VGAVTDQFQSEADVSMLGWNRQSVSRFWDFEARRPDADTQYFTYHHGRSLTRLLSRITGLEGVRVLDFGSGPGFLVHELLERGAIVAACDYSSASVEAARDRFHGRPGWLGSHLVRDAGCPFPDGAFDVICCVETIEHSLEGDLSGLFREIRRLLRINGLAVFTTPNSEDLSRNHVLCANCCAVFHRWQHVRSWTPALLRQELESQGYDVPFCDGLNIDAVTRDRRVRLVEISLQRAAHEIRGLADRLLDALGRNEFLMSREFRRCIASHARPHLVAIARRR
jgi:2-polyprenyl-3-methyl-5-hydroxy-6-metoxy-1,4-benzoquinol methylase